MNIESGVTKYLVFIENESSRDAKASSKQESRRILIPAALKTEGP